ncbi:MAG TPA: 3-deoxy-manno-octulosonate cytidylyltransferase [Ignavibacteria bacterium]|nr:3-deoxy-manno-octulosonate cytidylyltransferase [Ignavibacteria bacterium]
MKRQKAKSKNSPVVIGVIPARYGSTRLPAKALAMIHGKPMIQHVYERCLKSKQLSEVLVATDDKRIFDTVINFGGNVVMTSKSHKSGTDRIGEAVKNIKCDIVVNIQGDEPMIDPKNIDKAVDPLIRDKNINVSTLCFRISDIKEIYNPNVVKLVFGSNNNALYFSRSVIPFNRDNNKTEYFKHIGLYVYRKDYLLKLIKMKPSKLELTEKLEQLRVLESGEKIKVVETKIDSHSVDTQADLRKIKKLI